MSLGHPSEYWFWFSIGETVFGVGVGVIVDGEKLGEGRCELLVLLLSAKAR